MLSRKEKFIDLVETPYQVWTEKVGSGPIQVLTLAGGPGLSHDYLEPFEDYLPQNGFSFYYYDQLGTGNSSKPNDKNLWTITRYVDEIEQVRKALCLDKFVLYGQSWGAILAIDYALKHPGRLQGLIISNMTASTKSYEKYLHVLRSQLSSEDQTILEKYEKLNDYHAPEYERVIEKLNMEHLCRVPMPECAIRSMQQWNRYMYLHFQGENEFVVTGTLKEWDRWSVLSKIEVPTLLLVGRHDTMSVEDKLEMKNLIPNSELTVCPNGSHLSIYDDKEPYFASILQFLNKLKLENQVQKSSATFFQTPRAEEKEAECINLSPRI